MRVEGRKIIIEEPDYKKTLQWLKSMEQVAESIFPEEGTEVKIPPWVGKINKHMKQTLLKPMAQLVDRNEVTPYLKGYLVGLIRWNLHFLEAMGRRFEKLSAKLEGKIQYEADRETLEKLSADMEKNVIDSIMGDMTPLEQKHLEKKIDLYLRKPYYKWGLPEATDFYRGLYRGLAGFMDEGGNARHSRPNTQILLTLWICWPTVEQMPSRAALHRWLCQFYGSELIGSEKRVRDICDSIGLRLAKRGRPRKLKVDKATSRKIPKRH